MRWDGDSDQGVMRIPTNGYIEVAQVRGWVRLLPSQVQITNLPSTMSTVKSASTTAIKQGNADPKGVTTSGSTNSGATYTFVGTSGSPTQLCIGCNQLMKQVAVNGTGDGVIVTLAGAGGSGNAYMILTLDQKVVDNDNWTVIISSPTDAGKGVTFQGGTGGGPGQ